MTNVSLWLSFAQAFISRCEEVHKLRPWKTEKVEANKCNFWYSLRTDGLQKLISCPIRVSKSNNAIYLLFISANTYLLTFYVSCSFPGGKKHLNRKEVISEYTDILKAKWMHSYELQSLVAFHRMYINILSTKQLYKTLLLGQNYSVRHSKDCSE